MKITLYYKAIFTDSYTEVCDNLIKDENGKTCLSKYLERLSKLTFNLDTVYMTNGGYINIPFTLTNSNFNLYDYNYIKVEDNNFIRYCFVDDIELRNQVAVVYYSEDYWHSYIEQIKFRKGALRRALIKEYEGRTIKRCLLPTRYDNFSINYIPIGERTYRYYMVAQVQTYEGARSGDTTYRSVTTCLLTDYHITAQGEGYYNYTYTYQEAILRAKLYVEAMSNKVNIYKGGLRVDGYYNIDNITIIPEEFKINLPSIINTKPQDTLEQTIFYDASTAAYIAAVAISPQITAVYDTVIASDYKRIGIGTLNYNFETIENGISYPLSIKCVIDNMDFKLYMYCQNKIIDITENFVYDVPINSITGEANAQRKMARALSTTQGIITIGEGVGQIIADLYTAGGATATQGVGKLITPSQSNSIMPYSNSFARFQENFASMQGEPFTYEMINKTPRKLKTANKSGAISGVGKIADGIIDIVNANAPIYSSTNFVSTSGINTRAIQLGLIEILGEAPINEDFVANSINETGYVVQEIVGEEIFTPVENKTHNILQFAQSILSAPTQLISSKIKEILNSGVKIWYDCTAI